MKKVLVLLMAVLWGSAVGAESVDRVEVHGGYTGLFNAGVEAGLLDGLLGAEGRVNVGSLTFGQETFSFLGFLAELRLYPFGGGRGLYLLGLSGAGRQTIFVTSTNQLTHVSTKSSGEVWAVPAQAGLGFKWVWEDWALDLGADGGLQFLTQKTTISGLAIDSIQTGLECYVNLGYRFKL